jgi:hypothetical protein
MDFKFPQFMDSEMSHLAKWEAPSRKLRISELEFFSTFFKMLSLFFWSKILGVKSNESILVWKLCKSLNANKYFFL